MSFYKKTFLIFLIILICITGISIRIGSEGLGAFDNLVTEYIQSFISDKMTTVMIVFTTIGSYKFEYPILFIAAIYYWTIRRNRLYPVVLVINLLGVRLVNGLLKEIFERPRPSIKHLVEVTGYSFPSGHAMISISFYGFMAYLIFYEFREKTNKTMLVPIIISIMILFIGLSRIYLGVHYPSDVLAGFLIGGLWLTFCIILLHQQQNHL